MRRREVAAAVFVAALLIVVSLDGDGPSERRSTSAPAASTPSTDSARTKKLEPVRSEPDASAELGAPSSSQAVGSAPSAPARTGAVSADRARQTATDDFVRERRRTDTAGLVEEPLPGGGVQVDLQARFAIVPVAIVTDDGHVRIEE